MTTKYSLLRRRHTQSVFVFEALQLTCLLTPASGLCLPLIVYFQLLGSSTAPFSSGSFWTLHMCPFYTPPSFEDNAEKTTRTVVILKKIWADFCAPLWDFFNTISLNTPLAFHPPLISQPRLLNWMANSWSENDWFKRVSHFWYRPTDRLTAQSTDRPIFTCI